MLSKPSEGMAYLHGLLSTSTHLAADLAFKTSQETGQEGSYKQSKRNQWAESQVVRTLATLRQAFWPQHGFQELQSQ